jgi:hypothetical protein
MGVIFTRGHEPWQTRKVFLCQRNPAATDIGS